MLLSLNKSTEFHKIHNLQSMKIIISPLVIFLVSKVKIRDWGDNACFPKARMSSLTHPLSPSSSPVQPWQFLCPSFCLSLILSVHLPLPISVFLPLSLCLSLSSLSLTCSLLLFLPHLCCGRCLINASLPLLCPHRQYCFIKHNHWQVPLSKLH